MSNADHKSAQLAAGQCGLINLVQLRALGFTRNQIRHRVATGRLVRVLPCVFRVAGVPQSWEQDLMAAHVWAGDNSAASFRAAARSYGFEGFHSAPIEISVVGCNRRPEATLPSGRLLVVHRVDEHLLGEIMKVRNIPVTSPRKTVLDLAGTRHRRAEGVLDAVLRREMTDVGQLWLLLEQEWMHGRRGVAILRDLLIPRTRGRAPTDSSMELDLRHLIDDARLPAPVHQYPFIIPMGRIRMDLAYPHRLLDIETDSLSWHRDRETFERDRRRDNELRALGWTVLRFTWAMIRFDSANTIALIRQHLVD
jgi:very-short-patch-repair endonuclease